MLEFVEAVPVMENAACDHDSIRDAGVGRKSGELNSIGKPGPAGRGDGWRYRSDASVNAVRIASESGE